MTEDVQVEQVDRELAYQLLGSELIRTGGWDNHPGLQAIARHRLPAASSPASSPDDDFIVRASRWIQNTGYDGGPQSVPVQMLALIIAQQAEIKELSGENVPPDAPSLDPIEQPFFFDEEQNLIRERSGMSVAILAPALDLEAATAMAAGPELHHALTAIVEAARNGEATIHPLLLEQAEAAVAAGSYRL